MSLQDLAPRYTIRDGVLTACTFAHIPGIVAYCDLSASDANEVLTEHCKYANMRGIRQMLDYHPVREQWRQAPHDKFMENPDWLAGLSLLPKHKLSFDMQIHVPQMQVSLLC